MLVSVLGLLHNAVTLLFGVYVSAAFLGVRMNRRNATVLFCFFAAVGLCSGTVYAQFGASTAEQLYPVLIHLPLVLFLTLVYKARPLISLISVLTAYLCCQISNWIGLAALGLSGREWVYYAVRIAVTASVFFLLLRYVASAVAQLFAKPFRSVAMFGLLPFVYYCFDYVTGVYTKLIFSGKEIVTEFLGFVICLSYLLFLLIYFRQYEEKNEAQRFNQLIKMQQQQAEKDIEAYRRSEREVAILRHDMRHFLNNISAFIENGEDDKAQEYIKELVSLTEKTAVKKYSNNEIANVILSSCEDRIKDGGIDFRHDVRLPEKLPFSDVDLTAILSNGLENAIRAVQPLEREKRFIGLELYTRDDKLLISIKNTFASAPVFVDGLPQAKRSGHGFGVQSIRYVTEKLNGNCQFTVEDGLFVLRIIL